jgi:hypothetical protein
MRSYGNHQDVTLIVQLGSHRHPHHPYSAANRAASQPPSSHSARAPAFFINPGFVAGTPPVKKPD